MNIFQNLAQQVHPRRSMGRSTYKHLSHLLGERMQANRSSSRKFSVLSDKKMSILGLGLIQQTPNNPVTKSVGFLSLASLNDEINRLKHKFFVISLSNPYKRKFDLLMDFWIWFSVITSLWYLAFVPANAEQRIADLVVWVFFIIDFFLNFFTEILTKKNQKIMNLTTIAMNYAQNWMLFDLASLLPLGFAGYNHAEYLLRLFRVFKMGRLMKRIKIHPISEFVSGLFYKEETRRKKKFRMIIIHGWDLLKELSLMLFATYLLACLWRYFSGSMVRQEHPITDFYENYHLTGLLPTDQFIITWYYIFTTLMTVGYGDYAATNKYEMGFAIILVIAGPTWFAFTMGKAINIINNIQRLGGADDKIGNMRIWISNIEEKFSPIPIELRNNIEKHFLHYWKNDRLGSLTNLSNEDSENFDEIEDPFYKNLPSSIKIKLVEFLFSDLFLKFKYFFKNFYVDRYKIALFLKPRIFLKYSLILRNEEEISEVFFKTNGTFQIGIKRIDSFEVIDTVCEDFVIGDYFVINNITSFVDFFAVNNVFGYTLPAFVMRRFMKNNKNVEKSILNQKGSYFKKIETLAHERVNTNYFETPRDENDPEKMLFDPRDNENYVEKCVFNEDFSEKIQEKRFVFKCIDHANESLEKLKEARRKKFWELKVKLSDFAEKVSKK